MNTVVPFMLVDGDQEAMEFQRSPGSYKTGLTTTAYKEGDIVYYNAGKVEKVTQATEALVQAETLYLAGQSYDQPFAKSYLLDKGVPLNVIPRRNRFVMTYKDDSADGVVHTFAAADLQAVQEQDSRGIRYDAVDGALVVTDDTTNPKCVLKGIFKGEVGDDNVQVIVELLPEAV